VPLCDPKTGSCSTDWHPIRYGPIIIPARKNDVAALTDPYRYLQQLLARAANDPLTDA